MTTLTLHRLKENFLVKFITDLLDHNRKYKEMIATVNELNKLSDSELRDIGISRGSIYGIAYETAYGDK